MASSADPDQLASSEDLHCLQRQVQVQQDKGWNILKSLIVKLQWLEQLWDYGDTEGLL